MLLFRSGNITMILCDKIIILVLFQVKLTPKKSKSCEGEKKLHQKTIHKELGSVKFSASKLERMKRLAQLLSKQIASISKQGELQSFCPVSVPFLSCLVFSYLQKVFDFEVLLMV